MSTYEKPNYSQRSWDVVKCDNSTSLVYISSPLPPLFPTSFLSPCYFSLSLPSLPLSLSPFCILSFLAISRTCVLLLAPYHITSVFHRSLSLTFPPRLPCNNSLFTFSPKALTMGKRSLFVKEDKSPMTFYLTASACTEANRKNICVS